MRPSLPLARPSSPPFVRFALLILCMSAAPAAGQLVPTRVSPIARADAFDVLPSLGLGMGGVSIAFRDTVADAWTNPAAAARLSGTWVFASPVAYDVSDPGGEGAAMATGVIGRAGPWFAAGALALQGVEPGRVGPRFPGPVLLEGDAAGAVLGADPSERSTYGYALIGRAWNGVAVGGSVVAARRHAVDGLGLLYGESDGLEAAGHEATFRVGVLGEWAGGRSLEAIAVHARTRMSHDVAYADFFWDPDTQGLTMTPRAERHADESDVWGLRVVHQRPLAGGWRLGALATANVADYPRLPAYDAPHDGVTNVAGARAEATAYEVGLGAVREAGPVVYGADLVYEPIRTRLDGHDGGGTTVANRIRWHNAVVRLGAGRTWQPAGAEHTLDARLGLTARRVDYRLAQFDHRQQAGRDEHRTWMEWTPTWGAGIRLGGFALRYRGSVLHGTERPGADDPFFGPCIDICVAEADLTNLPFPTPVLEPGKVTVLTQQVFISYLLGGAR